MPTHEVVDPPETQEETDSHSCTESTQKSRGQLCKALNKLGREIQQEVLDHTAKFGRLLHLEMDQNGRDHSEMLGMLDTLFTLIATDHVDSASLPEKEELVNGAERALGGIDTGDLSEEEDKEEETGPILPAFTSTSINTSCADSKATFEALRSTTSMEDSEVKTENGFPLLEATDAGEHAAADNSKGSERDNEPLIETQKAGKMASADTSKSGKKQVSFVQEESIKPKGSSITFYAKMSVNDLAELVSSALVSDLTPYACNIQASSGEEESSDSNGGGGGPSIIGVKYVSVMTKEKNTTNLRPVFAGRKDTKKNIIGFTVTGEILLSSEPIISSSSFNKDDNVMVDTDCEANNNSEVTPSVEQQFSKESELLDRTNDTPCDHHAERSCALSVPQIILTVPSGTEEEEEEEQAVFNGEHMAAVIEAPEEISDSAVVGVNKQQNTATSVTCGGACEYPQSAGKHCTLTGTETGESEVVTQQETEVSVSKVSNTHATNDGDSVTGSEADINRAHVERNGLQLEFDVAALSSAMCRALQLQIDPQILSQVFVEAAATQSITLDRTAFMSIANEDISSDNDNSSIQNSAEDTGVETACASDTVSTVEGQPEEQVPAPCSYRFITPSAINTTAELRKEMNVDHVFKDATTYSAATLSTASQNTEAKTETEVHSQMISPSAAPQPSAVTPTQTIDKSETEYESLEMDTEVNTETAIIPFNSQIITLKVFPNSAESATPCDMTLKKRDHETEVDASSKPNTEQALVPFDSQIVTLKAFNNDGKLIATYDTVDTVDKETGDSTSNAPSTFNSNTDSTANQKMPEVSHMTASSVDDGTKTKWKEPEIDTELVNAPDDDDSDYCIALASAELVKKNDKKTEPEIDTELVNAPDDDDSDYCIALASAELVKKNDKKTEPITAEIDTELVNAPDDDDNDYCIALASAELVKKNTGPKTATQPEIDAELVNAPDDDDSDYCIALASEELVKKNDKKTEPKTATQPEIAELVNAPDDDDSDYCIALASAELVKKNTGPKTATQPELDPELVNAPDDDDSDYCIALASAELVKTNTGQKTATQPELDTELVNAPDDDDSDYCIALASAELVKKNDKNTEPKTATQPELDTNAHAMATEKQMMSTNMEKSTQKTVTEASKRKETKSASHDSCTINAMEKEMPTKDVKVSKIKGTRSGSSHEDITSFLSKIRNSIASFRRSDLEKAVKPSDKRSPDEKFGQLRQTKSRPIKIPIEPPRKLLLPRRSKANRMYEGSIHTTDRGPMKVMSGAQLQQRPTTDHSNMVQRSGSGVKNSKSFHSQPLVITADITQLYAPVSGQPAQKQGSTGQLESIQTSKASLRKSRSRSNHGVPVWSATSNTEAVKSERLYKPRSLPATLHGADDLTNNAQMGKTQSETNSALPKLPNI